MNLLGQPNLSRIFHKPSLLTVSKAFVKIDEGHKKVAILLLAFFLELVRGKYRQQFPTVHDILTGFRGEDPG